MGNLELDSFFQEREARRRQELAARSRFEAARDESEVAASPGQSPDLFSLKDLALAAPRGVEGFVRSAAGLLEVVPGVDLGSFTEERTFGRSETVLGGVAEGIVQFTLGFLPGVGIAGKVAKLGALQRAAAAVPAGRFILNARAAQGAAFADFVAFQGHETRLSGLIESVPSLRNPVTQYLATNGDDSELEGRIKGVLEGLALGGLTDTLLAGLRTLKASRAARGTGTATAGKVPTPEELDRAVRKGLKLEPERGPTVEDLGGAPVRPSATPAPKGNPATPEGRVARMEALGISPEDAAKVNENWDKRTTTFGAIAGTNPRRMTPEELAAENVTRAHSNITQAALDRGGAAVHRAAEDLILEHGGREVIPNADVIADAVGRVSDLLQREPELTAETLALYAREGRSEINAARASHGKALSVIAVAEKAARDYSQLLESYQRGGRSWQDLQQHGQALVELLRTSVELRAERGRGLQILRANRTPIAEAAELVATKVGNMTEADFRKLAPKLQIAAESGDAALFALADMTFGRKFWAVTSELFINNILGSMKTQVVNLSSALTLGIFLPMEQLVGATITGNKALARESVGAVTHFLDGFTDSLRFAWKAGREGKNLLDPAASFRDDPFRAHGAIRSETFNVDPGSTLGSAIDWLGKAVRLPTAVLRGTDEFTKQLIARAHLKSEAIQDALGRGLDMPTAVREAETRVQKLVRDGQFQTEARVRDQGLVSGRAAGLEGAALQAHVDDYMRANFDEGMSEATGRAASKAREATLTTPLEPGTLGASISKVVNDHPFLRLVMPFVRTPVNIAKFTGQRLDLPAVARAISAKRFGVGLRGLEETRSRFLRDILSNDPRRKAEAAGRIATGTGLAVTALALAASGQLTGRGPTDPEQRRAMLDAGWQPYSVRTPDGFVQYLRLDPFATFFGLAADLYDTMRMAPPGEDPDYQDAFMAFAVSVANNLTQRTFLQGVGQFVDAISDPQRKMPAFFSQYAGALVPNSLAQATLLLGDEAYRDTHTMVERIRSRTPGLSETVAPQRNLLGEPLRRSEAFTADAVGAWGATLLPIVYREVSDDAIRLELGRLRHGFNPPPPRRLGLDLREFANSRGQHAWDRWQELHGQVQVRGVNLRRELGRLIRSPQYQAMPDTPTPEGPSPRVQLINSVVSRYRQEAWLRVLREYPELRARVQRAEGIRALRRRGFNPATSDEGLGPIGQLL